MSEPVGGGWSELRTQVREWRDSVERRLPPWWTKALAGAA